MNENICFVNPLRVNVAFIRILPFKRQPGQMVKHAHSNNSLNILSLFDHFMGLALKGPDKHLYWNVFAKLDDNYFVRKTPP